MKALMKLGFAAAAVMFANAAPASAAMLPTFCESGGNPVVFGGMAPGRCSMGDVDVGNDVTNYNAGSFGSNQGLIFKGYGDNGDSDIWTFTATTTFNAYLDLFASSGIGAGQNYISALFTKPDGTTLNIVGAASNVFYGVFAPGTYSVKVLGNIAKTGIYDYDLRVQAVPLPAAALLFGTGLLGAAGAGFRRRKTA